MTIDEAIDILCGIQADNLNLNDVYIKDKYEALGMAIKALEQKPCDEKVEQRIRSFGNAESYCHRCGIKMPEPYYSFCFNCGTNLRRYARGFM